MNSMLGFNLEEFVDLNLSEFKRTYFGSYTSPIFPKVIRKCLIFSAPLPWAERFSELSFRFLWTFFQPFTHGLHPLDLLLFCLVKLTQCFLLGALNRFELWVVILHFSAEMLVLGIRRIKKFSRRLLGQISYGPSCFFGFLNEIGRASCRERV